MKPRNLKEMWQFFKGVFCPHYPKGCFCSNPHFHEFILSHDMPCGEKRSYEFLQCCKCLGIRHYVTKDKTWTDIVHCDISKWSGSYPMDDDLLGH